MRDWILELTQFSSNVTLNDAQKAINAKWDSEVLPLCTAALQGRYPVATNGKASVMLDDFSNLFKTGGKIDAFFKANIQAFVDTSATPWKWRVINNNQLSAANETLKLFEKASEIRNAYFTNGGDKPSVSFVMSPVDLDVGSTRVALTIDGNTVSYAHGPSRPVEMSWPGSGVPMANLAFFPETAGEVNSINLSGPWSLFQLLEKAQVTKSSIPDQYTVKFTLGNRFAVFTLTTKSVHNPFSSQLLDNFVCPKELST